MADAHDTQRIDEQNSLYERATALVGFTTTIVPPIRLSWLQRWRVRRGIRLLERVIQLDPENWAALWVMGKALQATGDCERALGAFTRSHLINPDDPDVAREASISAMECARLDVALTLAERAVSLNAGDAGLRANLALVYLFLQQPQVAKLHIEEAHEAGSVDQVTASIQRIIDDVIAGRRSCPRQRRDIDRLG